MLVTGDLGIVIEMLHKALLRIIRRYPWISAVDFDFIFVIFCHSYGHESVLFNVVLISDRSLTFFRSIDFISTNRILINI